MKEAIETTAKDQPENKGGALEAVAQNGKNRGVQPSAFHPVSRDPVLEKHSSPGMGR